MRGDAQVVKERVDIAELIGGYLKLEKAGQNYKARCPFHNEKTASFHISPSRQTYYCFGCGKHGDAFTFIEEMEGTDFKGALKTHADRVGIELEYAPKEDRDEKVRLHEVLEEATRFFEANLEQSKEAGKYVETRGITDETRTRFRLGYAPDDWRLLRSHLLEKGFSDEELLKAGLSKKNEGGSEPYDVFRARIIFPLSDAQGRVIAFSGRAIAPDAIPKYLNSPDTLLFSKSEVLYGLDKAKDTIRKKNYAVLVEGQMDLVLSHQAGVDNAVASSGTAFTSGHLGRLRRLSPRIILAFDGDVAGEKAAEKSTALGLSLGMEVKVAELPPGKDPADLVRESSEAWKDILRRSTTAIEFFLERVLASEKDQRRRGLEIERRILPLVALVESAIERAHFVSIIAQRASLREEVLWEDLKRVKRSPAAISGPALQAKKEEEVERVPLRARIEERLSEVRFWQRETDAGDPSLDALKKEEKELVGNLALEEAREKLSSLMASLARAEALKDDTEVARLSGDIRNVHMELKDLEMRGKTW